MENVAFLPARHPNPVNESLRQMQWHGCHGVAPLGSPERIPKRSECAAFGLMCFCFKLLRHDSLRQLILAQLTHLSRRGVG